MSALTLAAMVALAASCGGPVVGSKFIVQEAVVESGLDPLAIHDNRTGEALHPATVRDAAALAIRLDAVGHDFDAGLMQINRRNWAWLGLDAASAFDPCASIGAASRLFVSVSKYNTGSATAGFANGYVARVAAAGRIAPRASASAAPPLPAPVPLVVDLLHAREVALPSDAAPVAQAVEPDQAMRTAAR